MSFHHLSLDLMPIRISKFNASKELLIENCLSICICTVNTERIKSAVFYSFFSSLQKTIEKNKHKYEARLRRLEAQMLTMVSRHAAQVNKTCFFTF